MAETEKPDNKSSEREIINTSKNGIEEIQTKKEMK